MKIIKLSKSLGLLAIVTIISLLSMQSSAASPGTSITVGAQSQPQRAGPPWLDPAWHYRRPIIINNSLYLPSYQVLIELDNENFPSFNLTKSDGSDVRITDIDGTTELPFWIESWNTSTQRGYVWFKISRLAEDDTTIYLYYGNPSALANSDGPGTFDYFDDDWSGVNQMQVKSFPNINSGIMGSFSWTTIDGEPEVIPPGYLSLAPGAGIKSIDISLPRTVGFKAKYGENGDHQRAGFLNTGTNQGTSIGDDCSPLPGDLFLVTGDQCTAFSPDNAWHNAFHAYEIRWKSNLAFGMIDHGISTASSNTQVPSGSLPVVLYSYADSGATLLVDWVYVRQYRDPEPTFTVGAEQGLVDLQLTMQDSPDPIPMNKELTYLLNIHNNSMIDAHGVIITDTLPANVQFVSSVPAGCSHNVDIVVCNLNTINANATASATIVVKPTLDGIIANHAVIDSLSYELDQDLADNTSQVQSLVDSVPPNVNWVKPVQNGYKYTTSGGLVTLEASAADNDQVVWVEFWLWNHIPPTGKITILKDYTYPYQAQLNSDDLLVVNEEYQIFVQAADRAGNISDYRIPPSPVIYLERVDVNYLFLPITVR